MRSIRIPGFLPSPNTLFGIAFLSLVTLNTHAENAATLPELKAAYLFNFTQFIDWPDEAFASAEASFNVCLLGMDDVFEKLKGALAHKHRQRVYDIKVIEDVSQSLQCQLLYFETDNPTQTEEYLNVLSDRSILTVSMEDEFIYQGGMIGFRQVGDHLRFAVNHDAMLKAGLKPSASMLEVADYVIQQETTEE